MIEKQIWSNYIMLSMFSLPPIHFLLYILPPFVVYRCGDSYCLSPGKETVHQIFGTRVAVLAGDFMFAQSSWYLANLENLEVIKLISQVYL